MKKKILTNRGIHLVGTQNFLKNEPFLPSGTHAYQRVRNVSFSDNFVYVLNE